MVQTEWIALGRVVGDTGQKGDTGDAFKYEDFTLEQLAGLNGEKGDTGPAGPKGDTGEKGDTGPKGDTGDTGATGTATTIKGSYNTYQELINTYPTGNDGDSYIVNGSLYVWLNNAWENVGDIKGDTGPQGLKGDTGAKGDRGDTGKTGAKGDKGNTGLQGVKGDTGATGPATDENAGWKLPVDAILTTTTLPTGVSKGYRVAIVTNSVMAIKEYNGSSWETESLDSYSVIPLKTSGSIQMYLAKSTGPVYMGVEYGVFGKFRFLTQAAYDALSSYDNDTIYFVRSS